MTKSQLIAKLSEIAKALGVQPTPLAWASLDRKELEARIADAEQELARQQSASSDSATSIAKRNDQLWFAAGGTRN